MFSRNTPINIIVLAAVIALTAWFLYKPVVYYSMSADQRREYARVHPTIVKQVFNLGLDLQGGMRLVLEIDRSKLENKNDKDVLDRAYAIIENRINGLGVTEPTIQKQGTDRLIIELPGLKDEGAAKNVIGKTAQLEFNLLREPAQLQRAVKTIDDVLKGKFVADSTDTLQKPDTTAVKEKEAQALADKVFGGAEAGQDTAKKDSTSSYNENDTSLAGVSSFRELLVQVHENMIGTSSANRGKVQAILRRTDVRAALERTGLGGNAFLWGHDTSFVGSSVYHTLYYVKAHPEMRGDVIKDARQEIDRSGMSGGYSVDMEMNSKGARLFSSLTGRNVGKYLAIVLDSTVYSAPVIRSKIPLGKAQITGSFTMEEATSLAIVLRAGALPAPVRIIEERTVGPSLGQTSVKLGMYSAIAGFAVVCLFMMFYYQLSGVFACIALMLNTVVVLSIMAGINATLTLPGIAGLILNMGMSVDANVLIFERIREELRVGKTVRSAIDAGYSRAFLTIFDSNMTTLIMALIFLWIGSGPIKGFAVTLILGILTSMYTALIVTRILQNLATRNLKTNNLSI